ncbi:MAG: hypothetical protein ABSC90_05785 [Acidimicrobiales bacterium]|jgi:hypothetical protein
MPSPTPALLTSWEGWDVRGGAAAEPAATREFTRSAPDRPGPDAHYELLAVAARGFRPPRFLSTAAVSEEDPREPETGQDYEALRPTWTLLYRQVAETCLATAVPHAVYLLGVDPPADATDDELTVFDEFYTEVHLPEVAERRHALRAARYELIREVKPPYRGAPQFLAVYEVDERGASNRRHVGPPYSTGPEVWQRHKTPWRLWYRRLAPGPWPPAAVE